ncbi:hypothetical protein CHS0354_018907 [Potamilus streckersoni]|uniref:Uncharacterized protein n=1 Tax=Potamilus streckersoni TaxID=2493646 RepID=A0AAE0SCX0_9BIVA|nr:hypothetical protein CHS0354_018907 [Potamilus streckersoni]
MNHSGRGSYSLRIFLDVKSKGCPEKYGIKRKIPRCIEFRWSNEEEKVGLSIKETKEYYGLESKETNMESRTNN